MISMYQWQKVKECRLKGMSIKKIARTVKMSKNTVRKYLRSVEEPAMKKREFPSRVTPHEKEVARMIGEGFIGTRIYSELKALGFSGSLSCVHRYVKRIRDEVLRQRSATTRFETEPGEQMQYDWKEWTLRVGGVEKKLYFHALILGFSRKKFYACSETIMTPDILRAIHEGMVSFGGSAKHVVIDNPKQMILLHRKDGVVRYNDHFLRFCGLFGIIPSPCQNYRAKTKGKVERPFFYLQEHFLRGLEVQSMEELDERLAAFTATVNATHHRGIETTPNTRFVEEQPRLLPLPEIDSSQWLTREIRKVSRDGFVSLDAKLYPVPMRLTGKEVLIENVFGKHFKVYENGHCVCEFSKRRDGAYQPIHPEHVVIHQQMDEKRKKRRSEGVIQFLDAFGPSAEPFFEGLKASQRENAYFHLHDILSLTQFYAAEDIGDILSDCCSMAVFHRSTVKGLLSKKPLKPPSVMEPIIGVMVPSGVLTRSLADYKELAHER